MPITPRPPANGRSLTDGDVKAIVDSLETRMVEKFRADVGRGVIGTVWRVLIWAFFLALGYLAVRGIELWKA